MSVDTEAPTQCLDCVFLMKNFGVGSSWKKICHYEETQIPLQSRAKIGKDHQSCKHHVLFHDLIKVTLPKNY